jgi:hypothetical protein
MMQKHGCYTKIESGIDSANVNIDLYVNDYANDDLEIMFKEISWRCS